MIAMQIHHTALKDEWELLSVAVVTGTVWK
jgi:hypothetical protein